MACTCHIQSSKKTVRYFMSRIFYLLLLFILSPLFSMPLVAQIIHEYRISFPNAVHHEAEVEVWFRNVDMAPLEVQMSRSSPGRYAIHNFARNVYGVRAFDQDGTELQVSQSNPQKWVVSGHSGTVRFRYTLFANRADGTYSQIDESHAHLNIPATFVFAPAYMHRPVEVEVNVREDLNWQIATQMEQVGRTRFRATDGYYFMDSPMEIADFQLREAMVDGQLIRLVLHNPASDREVNDYFDKVIRIVETQRDIFGELPDFDHGSYTFLSCYMPNASGDGMEHRNSTIVTSRRDLSDPLEETSISTIAHEFMHAWNVERIRPASLEPFDFTDANMSGELWFAEGFTSYYTGLTLLRAGIRDENEYLRGVERTLKQVVNAPGRQYFNPVEMSYRAPFVDAATAVDSDNNDNIFISYYLYGSVLGLVLDLQLRTLDQDLSLDGFMRMLWQTYGKAEIPYHIGDLESALEAYAGKTFSEGYFSSYIYDSQLPDMKTLLAGVGITLTPAGDIMPYLGAELEYRNDRWVVEDNPEVGSPFYKAGIAAGDEVLSLAGVRLSKNRGPDSARERLQPGRSVPVLIRRWGQELEKRVTPAESPRFELGLSGRVSADVRERRDNWLKSN